VRIVCNGLLRRATICEATKMLAEEQPHISEGRTADQILAKISVLQRRVDVPEGDIKYKSNKTCF